MAQNLYFEVPSCFEDDSIQMPCDGDYAYWFQLLELYIPRADRVEVHCWDAEEASLADLFAQCADEEYHVMQELQMTRVQLTLTPAFIQYLRTSSLNGANEMKWFALRLFREDTCLFCSDHWGVEFYIPNIEEADVAVIQKLIPEDSNFHLYEATTEAEGI